MIHSGLGENVRAAHWQGDTVPGESIQPAPVRRRALDDHRENCGDSPTHSQALGGGLIAPATDLAALRRYMERLLGWSNDRGVELAMRSLETATAHRSALVLCGEGDLVPVAHGLHRCALSVDRPFVVCDWRRNNSPRSVRSPANRTSGVAALKVAAGGSLCVRAWRLPRDFPALVAQLRSIDDVMFMLCIKRDMPIPLLARPAPINVPPLASRAAELDRVIAEYAADAIAELSAPRSAFTTADHAWVRRYCAVSLTEIEKATLRLVALRTSRNMSVAAARLDMAPVSLTRWLGRRELPPMIFLDQRKLCVPTAPATTRAAHGGHRRRQ